MHIHTIAYTVLLLVMLTAGFLICELNWDDLKDIYQYVKDKVYKS